MHVGFLQDWGRSVDMDNLQIKWHRPTEASMARFKDLMKMFFRPEMDKVQGFIKGEQLSR